MFFLLRLHRPPSPRLPALTSSLYRRVNSPSPWQAGSPSPPAGSALPAPGKRRNFSRGCRQCVTRPSRHCGHPTALRWRFTLGKRRTRSHPQGEGLNQNTYKLVRRILHKSERFGGDNVSAGDGSRCFLLGFPAAAKRCRSKRHCNSSARRFTTVV